MCTQKLKHSNCDELRSGGLRVLLAILVIFVSHQVSARPLSQIIYEDLKGRRCGEAGFREVEELKCRANVNGIIHKSFDETSEMLVFTDLATRELARLKCTEDELTRIIESSEIKQSALGRTCKNLNLLKDSVDNEAYLKRWIESYETINNRRIRNVPDAEFAHNSQVIHGLKSHLVLYQENINILRENDVLLSSPNVFNAVMESMRSGTFTKGKTPAEACSYLKSNLDRLLKAQRDSQRKSTEVIRSKLASGVGLIKDTSFKRELWASPGRNDFAATLGGNFDFHSSTLCRMEARYGEGAVHQDKLTTLASLALGFGASALGRVAGWVYREKIATAVYAERANVALNAARTATVVEIAIGTSLVSPHVIDACFKDHLRSTSGQNACEAKSESEFKSLFYKQQNAHACAIAGGGGAVFAGLAALSARGLFKGVTTNELSETVMMRATQSRALYERTRNEISIKVPELKVQLPSPASPSAIGFQGERRIEGLLTTADTSELPAARVFQELKDALRIYDSTDRVHIWLYGLSPDRLRQFHGQLMKDNPSYRAAVQKASGGDSELPEYEMIRAMREGFKNGTVDKTLYFPKVERSKAINDWETLYHSNQEFKIWYYNQPISVTEATKDLDAFAKKILSQWGEEVARRYRPHNALKGLEYVRPDIEAKASIAYFGDTQYMASSDGKVWLATQAQGSSPKVIPRWTGTQQEKFTTDLFGSQNPNWQTLMAEKYAAEFKSANQLPLPVAHPEASPTTKGGIVYEKGSFFSNFENHRAGPLIERAINSQSWGYHVAPFDRLQGIVDNGWLPGQATASGTGLGSKGLHMSTHLRVDHDIGGQSQVILRTPLRPSLDKAGAREDAGGDVLFHGHVYRNVGIEKDKVAESLEFSVDNGVSWYPLTPNFVSAAKKGLLPNFRAVPAPN